MAKYLFCLPRYHTNVEPWVRVLQQNGHEVAVHVTSVGPTESHSRIVPTVVECSRLSLWLIGRSASDVGELRRFPAAKAYWRTMKRADADVVIVRGVTRWFSRLAAIIALLQRRRLVIYDQEDVTPNSLGTWIRRAAFRLLGVPHVTARLPRQGQISGLGSAQSLPFGSPDKVRPPSRSRSDLGPVRILMVAKYRRRKGHEVLLEALRQIAGERDFLVTFCGEQATESDVEFCNSLRMSALEKGLANKVEFRHNVPYEQMGDLYASHEVFVLPSVHEPAAVSIIEAAWHGCAVLVSSDTGTREYIPSGQAFEFNARDVSDVARALAWTLQDPVRTKDMGEQCAAHIARVASDEVIMSRLNSLLPPLGNRTNV